MRSVNIIGRISLFIVLNVKCVFGIMIIIVDSLASVLVEGRRLMLFMDF